MTGDVALSSPRARQAPCDEAVVNACPEVNVDAVVACVVAGFVDGATDELGAGGLF